MQGSKGLAAGGIAALTTAAAVADSKLGLGFDLWTARKLLPGIVDVKSRVKKADMSLADVWADSVAKYSDRTFIVFEHRRVTFKDVDVISNQMAHWLRAQGFGPGQTLALMMENKPEFVCWWLAMTKIGVKAAFLNYNLLGKGLAHCVKVAECAGVVCDADTEANLHSIEASLSQDGTTCIYWAGVPKLAFSGPLLPVSFDTLLGLPYGNAGFAELRKGISYGDVFGYIYTSGTTGMPKAAQIPHFKMVVMTIPTKLLGLTPEDRMYTCLPIYHSAGGGIGVMSCLTTGATLVLSKKYSASRFWTEICENECTVFQYIGELGRYMVNYAKEHPEVKSIPHKLRAAVGNGLRPEVWDDFQDGFNIPVVIEFYAATEGNGGLINYCAKGDKRARGAVGRMGKLLTKVMGIKLVKFDVETETPVRGPDGLCVECDVDEAGELIMPIVAGDVTKAFPGYTDKGATNKKIIADAFSKGDTWFRSGDLLSRDSTGLYFFVDRIGDTFRWKGENVSTMEVSEIISNFPGVQEANVYGVKVPGVADGRGCMVAINGGTELHAPQNLDALQAMCEKELPVYARPLFLRFLPAMDVTGTFKHQKAQLREEGCELSKVKDPVFFYDAAAKRYMPFTAETYARLEGGQSKL